MYILEKEMMENYGLNIKLLVITILLFLHIFIKLLLLKAKSLNFTWNVI